MNYGYKKQKEREKKTSAFALVYESLRQIKEQ